MKIDKEFSERVRAVSVKDFFNFYFLKENVSLIMRALYFKLYICIENIAVEETMSQIFYLGPGSFSTKFRKNIQKSI